MGKPLRFQPEKYAAVKALVAAGESIAEITRQTGVGWEGVKANFPNAGKTVGSNGGLTLDKLDPERYRLMGEMVADGASLNEIMRSLGCDHRTIKRAFPQRVGSAAVLGKRLRREKHAGSWQNWTEQVGCKETAMLDSI